MNLSHSIAIWFIWYWCSALGYRRLLSIACDCLSFNFLIVFRKQYYLIMFLSRILADSRYPILVTLCLLPRTAGARCSSTLFVGDARAGRGCAWLALGFSRDCFADERVTLLVDLGRLGDVLSLSRKSDWILSCCLWYALSLMSKDVDPFNLSLNLVK